MNRVDLIAAVRTEAERVWPGGHLDGTEEQYAWLEKHYSITEDEDVQWRLIWQHERGELPEDDLADEGIMAFLLDESAVTAFLEKLRAKYQSGTAIHERRSKPR